MCAGIAIKLGESISVQANPKLIMANKLIISVAISSCNRASFILPSNKFKTFFTVAENGPSGDDDTVNISDNCSVNERIQMAPNMSLIVKSLKMTSNMDKSYCLLENHLRKSMISSVWNCGVYVIFCKTTIVGILQLACLLTLKMIIVEDIVHRIWPRISSYTQVLIDPFFSC